VRSLYPTFLTRTLQGRLVLATFGPIFLLTVLLTFNSIRDRQRDNLAELQDIGNNIASSLATIADFALHSGDRRLLSSLAASVAQMSDVRGVAFRDGDGHTVVASAGFRMPSGPINDAVAQGEAALQENGLLYFARPVSMASDSTDEVYASVPPSSPAKRIGSVIVAIDLAPSLREYQTIVVDNSAIAVAVMAVAFVISYVLSGAAIAPISALTHTVSQMERGDLTVRAEPLTRDELATLTHGINHLAESVARSQQTMEYRVYLATGRLQKTLEDLQLKNQELETATLAAESANQAKGQFLARMSHELRTPLTAIHGFVQLLEKSNLPPSEKSYCAIIDQAAVQLLTLIDEILEFTRLQSQAVELDIAAFNLAECLEHPVRLMAPLAHDKGLQIVLDIDPEVPLDVVGDHLRLRQILSNLVSNAIKFTASGHVRVTVSRFESDAHIAALEIVVEDTGIGIGREQQLQIFSAFVQADTSISRRFGGAGLGLAIVKSLTALMGGSIMAERNPHGGTRMRLALRLPRAPDHSLPALSGTLALYDPDPLSRVALIHSLCRMHLSPTTYLSFDDLVDQITDQDRDIFIVSTDAGQSSIKRIATLTQIRAFSASPILVLAPLHVLNAEMTQMSALDLQPLVFLAKPAGLQQLHTTLTTLQGHTDQMESTGRPLLGLRLLVAEDNAFSRLLLKTLLDRVGCHCAFATTGSEAIALSQQLKFDAMLIDIHMPGVNGIDAIAAIKQHGNPNLGTPIIVLTADVLQYEEDTELAARAQAILLKPFVEAELVETLRALTGRPDQRVAEVSTVWDDIPRELYFNEIDAIVGAAERAHVDGDCDQLGEYIHQLQGIAGVFKLGSLETQVRALHAMIKANDYTDVACALAAIRAQVHDLRSDQRSI